MLGRHTYIRFISFILASSLSDRSKTLERMILSLCIYDIPFRQFDSMFMIIFNLGAFSWNIPLKHIYDILTFQNSPHSQSTPMVFFLRMFHKAETFLGVKNRLIKTDRFASGIL